MDAILIFLKHPTPGRVKTRLAASVGVECATAIYRQMVEHVCRSLPSSATPVVLFDPPESGPAMCEWLAPLLGPDAQWLAQCADDLGARLSAAFAQAFTAGFHRVAAIGCDCLELTPSVFTEAFEAVATPQGEPGEYEVAIGPAWDGGYYLLALARHRPELFEGIPWSTQDTLAETLARAAEHNLRAFLLEKRHDVDTEQDWKDVKSRLRL